MKENSPFKGKFGPLLISEIGGNHEGDFEYAKRLTELAISTNVDYVKFQLYTGDTLVSKVENPQRNQHFKKFELTKEQHIELAKMVTGAGIGYMASVWDEQMMTWINEYLPIYKVGSGDLTAYPILKKIASFGKPIILSTGLSTEKDVLDAVTYIQSLGSKYKSKNMLALLQCTSMYPIAAEDANLAVIQRLKELTGLTTGYSDHTEGLSALKYAFAMGAEVLEFHFTDTRKGKVFRDHKVSLIPSEVEELKNELVLIDKLRGKPQKKPLDIEIENGHDISFRRAVYLKRDILAGETITENDLVYLRPMHGVDTREFGKIIGTKAKNSLSKFEELNWKLME
jgi:N,N'-diacetyllegionaminate synthase